MKKVLSVIGSLVLSIGMLFGFSGSASAAGYYFSTNDGQWDGTVTVKTYGNKVLLAIDTSRGDLWTNPAGLRLNISDLKARLCNASSTSNCTSPKALRDVGGGFDGATWTNMIPGTYRLDITEPYSYTVSGYTQFSVFEDY
ncbi:hypothetical protein CN568_18420 [Bacillus pseudomycoides]|uniref:hypothetical protein n=1 Tax=Bacillus pseudomycoides TaxID=64104 RepID=UPI0002EBD57D|nr:hypothetical protein [Bacillus pseudomycoides]PEK38305.1 hypothetical protein CN691_05630 [Bacillus pseudomycoides]PEP39008.1 hypothetical protein CN565_23990 [Bacillus pseudomycoides]PEP42717.1 hypothetical protein CN568_18420 [Bacillus pseudomycoides]PFX49688.1 hypothetical protein COL31_18060 [Bacillus pseudomycoides]PFZ84074.1 hypothetical protein COL69_08605 [Bacillus pseudomycoides]